MKIQIFGQKKGRFSFSQTTRFLSDSVEPIKSPFGLSPISHGESRFCAFIDTDGSNGNVHIHL